MPNSNRGDRSALVALALILAALVIVAIFEMGSRQPLYREVERGNPATAEQYQEQRGPAEGYWLPEVSARDTYAQWAMAVLALAAIGISIVGVVLIRRTFEETKRTANAAVDQVSLTREALYVSQRARVSLLRAEATGLEDPRTGQVYVWRFGVAWRNSGATPTLHARSLEHLILRDDQIPDDFDFPDGDKAPHWVAIGGLSEMRSDVFDIGIADMMALHRRERRAFFWAWIDYNDIFPKTPRHRTEVSYEIRVEGDPRHPRCHIAFPGIGRFSGIDDECVREPAPYQPRK